MEHTLAILVIVTGLCSIVCLLLLHFISPEFNPNWRMVSEYALGNHKWLLTSFFILWAASNFLLGILLCYFVNTTWAIRSIVLIFVSGTGAFMGGLFDIRHRLHGLSFTLGVPFFPIAALLIAYGLNEPIQIMNHLLLIKIVAQSTWISVLIMVVSMMLLFSGFKKAGIKSGSSMPLATVLPKGIVAFNGYANRLLILVYISFNLVIAFAAIATH